MAAVQALVTIRPRFIDALSSVIATWVVQPVLWACSAPRPEARGDGDAAQQWARQVQALRQAAESMTGHYTQVVELPASALREAMDSHEPIVESWRRDLVLVQRATALMTAADLLLADALDTLLDIKDQAHYGITLVRREDAVRRATSPRPPGRSPDRSRFLTYPHDRQRPRTITPCVYR